jgi:hypothetical protein
LFAGLALILGAAEAVKAKLEEYKGVVKNWR